MFGQNMHLTGAGATSATIIGLPPAVFWALVSLFVMGIGAMFLWYFAKTGFQVLLENCFWGKSETYRIWGETAIRPAIESRLRLAQGMQANIEMANNYQIELQEFLNYLNMPKLELTKEVPFAATLRGLDRTYTYRFTLPNFHIGVSEIEYALYTASDFDETSGQITQTKDEALTQIFTEVVAKKLTSLDQIHYQQGAAVIEVQLILSKRANLFWVYKPQPDQLVPARQLTANGLQNPIIGMLNEDPL